MNPSTVANSSPCSDSRSGVFALASVRAFLFFTASIKTGSYFSLLGGVMPKNLGNFAKQSKANQPHRGKQL